MPQPDVFCGKERQKKAVGAIKGWMRETGDSKKYKCFKGGVNNFIAE